MAGVRRNTSWRDKLLPQVASMLSHQLTALLQLCAGKYKKIQWLINVATGEVGMVQTNEELTQGLVFV